MLRSAAVGWNIRSASGPRTPRSPAPSPRFQNGRGCRRSPPPRRRVHEGGVLDDFEVLASCLVLVEMAQSDSNLQHLESGLDLATRTRKTSPLPSSSPGFSGAAGVGPGIVAISRATGTPGRSIGDSARSVPSWMRSTFSGRLIGTIHSQLAGSSSDTTRTRAGHKSSSRQRGRGQRGCPRCGAHSCGRELRRAT
jgi:hypothetical protein